MNKQIISTLDPKKILLKADQHSEVNSAFEAEDFSEEKLDREAKRNEHNRTEGSKNILYKCNIFLIIALYGITFTGVITLGWHWVSPMKYHFVTSDQLDIIKTLLFSALATNFAKEFHKKPYKA